MDTAPPDEDRIPASVGQSFRVFARPERVTYTRKPARRQGERQIPWSPLPAPRSGQWQGRGLGEGEILI